MSKTIQLIDQGPDKENRNLLLTGDRIRLWDGNYYRLDKTDLTRLSMWCEDNLRRRDYSGCCDQVRDRDIWEDPENKPSFRR